ncbi:hypothetical protein LNTAR_15087 [Lentisphaera araneosa HTCC2155]|uniref:Uncharacterized protein n=1 Tax=Lentisphaera araneosa HTCC2155 TaxID=313628 RepID=A6DRE2_9BACT|nr:SIR2 family protein [Lentisphaera araneosa]EDM25752.1 hypothetical protein LNTAR_15087 [Lentisphaera araneosa HTCC2155]
MKIKDIDFPDEILRAQEEGTLVVFAGAGVSIPSGLPNFYDLVDKVAKGSGIDFYTQPDLSKKILPAISSSDINFNDTTVQEMVIRINKSLPSINEPPDKFLGKLEDNDIKIHERSASILSSNDYQPNLLHQSIVDLFRDEKSVRIVTTNFDKLFTDTLGAKKFNVETYTAPALPLGSDFSGLVYLHGTVDKPSNTVLTDRDFSQAYITRGWARFFIQDMLENYTVLFIGYSYDDIIMSYLTRGIDLQSKKHFALSERPKDHWDTLNINVIPFPLYEDGDKFRALGESLSELARLSSMGVFDHKKRISDIALKHPPLQFSEEDDYLLRMIQKANHLSTFTDVAKGADWIKWSQERALLEDLFNSDQNECTERSNTLADWLCLNGISSPQLLLDIYCKSTKGKGIAFPLWSNMYRHMFNTKFEVHEDTRKLWLPVLLENWNFDWRVSTLEDLLNHLLKAKEYDLSLQVISKLFEPRLHATRSDKITFPICQHQSKELYETLGDLPSIYQRKIFELLVSKFQQAHSLATIYMNSSRTRCVLCWRAAIEDHSQNYLHYNIDYLVNILRDILKTLEQEDSHYFEYVLKAWLESDIPLFRRLAVNALGDCQNLGPKEKLSLAVNLKLMKDIVVYHEFFVLIGKLYPQLPVDERKALISHIKAKDNKETDRFGDYLLWIKEKSQVDCPVLKQYIEYENLEGKTLSKYVGFLSYSYSSCSGVKSPLSGDKIRSMPVPALIDFTLNFKDEFMGARKDGLFFEVRNQIIKDSKWGMTLAKYFISNEVDEELQNEFTHRVLSSWQQTTVPQELWTEILSLLENHNEVFEKDYNILNLLESGIKHSDSPIPQELWKRAETLVRKLYLQSQSDEFDLENDVLSQSINHSGGVAAQFYIHLLLKQRKLAAEDWSGIDEYNTEILELMLNGSDPQSHLSRVCLLGQLHLFYYWDPDWTEENMLIHFNWDGDATNASLAWHGFLAWGHWQYNFIDQWIPYYLQCFDHLDELENLSKPLVEHIAQIYMFADLPQATLNELLLVLNKIDATQRSDFTCHLGWQLGHLEQERIDQVWSTRLEPLVSNRLQGIPVVYEKHEYKELIEVLPKLKASFRGAVELITSHEFNDLNLDSSLWHYLLRTDLIEGEVQSVAKLVIYIIKNNSNRWLFSGRKFKEFYERLYPLLSPDLKRRIDELLELNNISISG